MEGSKIGLVQFGVPAMVGLLIPSHPYVGGALAGAAVVTGRAGGFVRENLGATISGALIGALAGHASARFGLTGALAAAGIGALAVGAQAARQSESG
ncbi:hypothetical protein IV102_18590 [bacterium]|nr:hypothetical protein [bacterium]